MTQFFLSVHWEKKLSHFDLKNGLNFSSASDSTFKVKMGDLNLEGSEFRGVWIGRGLNLGGLSWEGSELGGSESGGVWIRGVWIGRGLSWKGLSWGVWVGRVWVEWSELSNVQGSELTINRFVYFVLISY